MDHFTNPRLKVIAGVVGDILDGTEDSGRTVCDIGTDHGFLPIHLVETGIAERAIMTDISEDSLDKARSNALLMDAPSGIEPRLGDGLDPLEEGEADVIVIAGVGGYNILEMLEWDEAKSRSFPNYVLQPRNNAGALRAGLKTLGIGIDNELVVKEGRHFAEIIVASPYAESISSGNEAGDIGHAGYESLSFQEKAKLDFPDDIEDRDSGSTVKEYLFKERDKAEALFEKISKGSDDEKAIARMKARKERLLELCKKLRS